MPYKHYNEQQIESIRFDARHDYRNNNYLFQRELNRRLQDAKEVLESITELREIYTKEFDKCLILDIK